MRLNSIGGTTTGVKNKAARTLGRNAFGGTSFGGNTFGNTSSQMYSNTLGTSHWGSILVPLPQNNTSDEYVTSESRTANSSKKPNSNSVYN